MSGFDVPATFRTNSRSNPKVRSKLSFSAFLLFVLGGTAVGQSPTTPVVDSTINDSTSSANPTADAPQATLTTVKITGTTPLHRGYLRLGSAAATKTPTLLRDIPQAMSVINRALIEDQSMQNMVDVVRYVPGITMGQGEGNRDQPTIRGNSTTADFYVDGVRDDAQYFRDLYNVERVEALKGPNAMIFGRGGGGGVINRVVKEAGWSPAGDLSVQAGSYDNRRATIDAGRALNEAVAGRLNGVYEDSRMFRDHVWTKRQGVNPTLGIGGPSAGTRLRLGYENFVDYRTADRGIPSFGNVPIATDISAFFGNPEVNFSRTRVNSGSIGVTQLLGRGVTLNNHTLLTSYDKSYQNVLPGAVAPDGDSVGLTAYNNSHQRRNAFNQTDLMFPFRSGAVVHTLLIGAELGRQTTDNFRNTGYFNDSLATLMVPTSSPTTVVPVSFRQSATDADNRVSVSTRSIYAQDQLDVTDYLKLIGGVRYESFGLRFHNNRSGVDLTRDDRMISPRFGLIVKPTEEASLYASYGVSYLPGSGDQFSSLTDVSAALDPEKFTNVEAGAKWDVANRVALTAAIYQLYRTNTRATSPNDPSLIVQTGRQRSRGYELSVAGQPTNEWNISGGFARQQAIITSTTAAAPAGTTVPVVPSTTLSLWNKYQLSTGFSVALGAIHQSDMYAAVTNTVRLPAFTRFDGAVYYSLNDALSAQVNVENVLNENYYPLANGNNNITPGAPRSIRATLMTHF